MTTVRTRSAAERVRAATRSAGDVDTLAHRAFTALAADVPFAFACLATADPASELITAAIKSHPIPLDGEEFAAVEYGAPDVNQFAEIIRREPPVGVLSLDTGGDVGRCRRFREYMTPKFGFTDELRLACRTRGATWGLLGLYRGEDEPAFTARDAAALAGVPDVLAEELQRVLFTPGAPPGVAPAPAVLIVDGADDLVNMTAAAEAHLDELGGREHGSLPDNVLAAAATARHTGAPATSRVRGRSGGWLTLHAMPLDGPTDGASAARSVVLTVDAAAPAAVGQLALVARGLTAREQDVARLVLQGASTKAIADTLFLSPHTVQDHLKAIFAKLGVRSRREMVAQLVQPG